MSFFLTLMACGWITTVAMFGFCALNESGKLNKIRERIALWLGTSVPKIVRTPEESLQPERENAA